MNSNHNISEPLTAIILAGGKSSRMGKDKGMVIHQGKPFISHITEAVKPLVSRVIIIADNKAYDRFGFERFDDEIKETGPLAGLYSGLKHSDTDWNLVLSCDIPLVSSDLLNFIAGTEIKDEDIIQFVSEGNRIPLIALYHKRCMDACLKLIESGEKRLLQLQQHHKTTAVQVPEKYRTQVKNINSTKDLKLLQHES